MNSHIMRRIIAQAAAVIMLAGVFGGCGGDPTATNSGTAPGSTSAAPGSSEGASLASTGTEEFPRTETLYFGGQQWGSVASFNPFNPAPNNWAYTNGIGLLRSIVFEGLFMYNPLDGTLTGLLGTEYSWDNHNLTVKMNPDAKWNDGTPLTAEDVAYTYALAQKYATVISAQWEYLDSVTAPDPGTVVFTAKADNFAPKMLEQFISSTYIVPKHIWEPIDAEANGDSGVFIEKFTTDFNLVSSGPYKVQSADATKVVHVRNDNYWGQAPSMFGKLPIPKYIVHNIFQDNDSTMNAFRQAQIDVNQQFMPQIWKLWEDEGLPISTYIPEPPYYIPGAIPSIFFNLSKPGLDDPVVRRALAMAIDYDMIAQNAMSGYSAPMSPSLMLPTAPMQALIDAEALKPLQWVGGQVDEANSLLEENGWVVGADGIREKNGVKLSFKIECPTGWTDWNASLEVVAQSGREIGMDIVTNFRDFAVYWNDFINGNVDIGMWNIEASSVASPWYSARYAMSSVGNAPVGQPATFNFGRYRNDRADEIIAALSTESDPAKMKELWTELNSIYLTEVPSVGLMYRPAAFHEVNETVWTGFPKINDGSNIPPTVLTDGYGIKALYNIVPQ